MVEFFMVISKYFWLLLYRFCNVETISYVILYPKYVRKIIYFMCCVLKQKKTTWKFEFAGIQVKKNKGNVNLAVAFLKCV